MKLFSFFILILLLVLPSYAIDWISLESLNGSDFYLDLDSIKKHNNYYFYNIKVLNTYKNTPVVITIQSKVNSGISARINYYDPSVYQEKNGDYENILNNSAKKFETFEYGSIVHAAFQKVNSVMQAKQIKIEF